MEKSLQQLLHEVEQVALKAGAFLRQEQEGFSIDRVEEKHAHDYVSDVDKNTEQIVVADLKRILPEAGFVTEEGLASFQGEERYWVVDPLDGTTNFIHGHAPFAVSIALCRNLEIELGVVYDARANELFSAYAGGGATLNGKPIHVSANPIQRALLGIELPYAADCYSTFGMALLKQLYGYAGGIRMNGSAAVALCHVAAGRLDGWLEKYIGRYDYMAGAIIVEEAGGKVTNFAGDVAYTTGDNIVATNGIIQQELLEQIKKTGVELPNVKKK